MFTRRAALLSAAAAVLMLATSALSAELNLPRQKVDLVAPGSRRPCLGDRQVFHPPQTDLETWFIRAGSAGAALYKFRQPGIYAYVSHNLIEAADLGATAHFKVEGKWNDNLMTQVKAPEEIPPAESN